MNGSADLGRPMAPEELSYGIDVTGLDPASLTDSLRAVISDVMMDPMRMTMWLTGFALAEQNVGMKMLQRLSGRRPSTAAAGPRSGWRRGQAVCRPGVEQQSVSRRFGGRL